MNIEINSQINDLGYFPKEWTADIIKNEPMFFNCDYDFAMKNGGMITRKFLERLPPSWANEDFVIDSRVHMLMKGWFPCIPGFHHDDVPRSGKDGQPNYINPEYRSVHLMGLVNAEICPTEFAIGKVTYQIPKGIIYKDWHNKVVNDIFCTLNLKLVRADSGRYIEFDDRTFHQGTKAISNGWRWFIRLSKNTDRTKTITNEVRKQVQVYLENPMEGW